MNRRGRSLLAAALLALALLAGVAGALAASPRQTTHRNHMAARAMAARILGDLVLPAGSTRVPREPAGSEHTLDEPQERPLQANQVDLVRFWTTRASPEAVIASIERHLPAHVGAIGTGSTESSGGGGSESIVTRFRFRDRERFSLEQLVVDGQTLKDGRTGVRADGQVVYRAPRPADERVPTSARVLDITRTGGPDGPRIDHVVTERASVLRFARLIDRLPFVGSFPGATTCPGLSGTSGIVAFTFRQAARGPALARFTTSADMGGPPCEATVLRVRDRDLGEVLGGGGLLRTADRLLHLKLVERDRIR